jgi:hypothetical protein
MRKKEQKTRSICSKGHDINLVGRTKSGNCKMCHQEYYKARWLFIKNNFPKESL